MKIKNLEIPKKKTINRLNEWPNQRIIASGGQRHLHLMTMCNVVIIIIRIINITDYQENPGGIFELLAEKRLLLL